MPAALQSCQGRIFRVSSLTWFLPVLVGIPIAVACYPGGLQKLGPLVGALGTGIVCFDENRVYCKSAMTRAALSIIFGMLATGLWIGAIWAAYRVGDYLITPEPMPPLAPGEHSLI